MAFSRKPSFIKVKKSHLTISMNATAKKPKSVFVEQGLVEVGSEESQTKKIVDLVRAFKWFYIYIYIKSSH